MPLSSPAPVSASSWTVFDWDKMPRSSRDTTAAYLPSEGVIAVLGNRICHTYDICSQSWAELPPCPTTRHGGFATVGCHNTIIVLGGAAGEVLSSVDAIILDRDEEGRWDHCRWYPLPNMITERKSFAAVNVEDSAVVVLGGRNDSGYLQTAEILHDMTWHPLPDMSEPRPGCCAATIGNKVFCFGGYADGSYPTVVLDTAEVLDLSRGIWEALPTMPRCRCMGAAVVVGQYILLTGGNGGGSNLFDLHLSAVDCFDTVTNQWILNQEGESPLSLKAGRVACGAATSILQEDVYVFGGKGIFNVDLNSVEMISINLFFLYAPSIVALMNHEDLPLGLWPHILAACPANVMYFLLSSERVHLDSVLLRAKSG